MNKVSNFFKEVKHERKETTWPTFKEMSKNTSSVITIIILLATFFFIAESGLTWLLSFI